MASPPVAADLARAPHALHGPCGGTGPSEDGPHRRILRVHARFGGGTGPSKDESDARAGRGCPRPYASGSRSQQAALRAK